MLREDLAKKHTVAFFRDSGDLVEKVLTAAAGFPRSPMEPEEKIDEKVDHSPDVGPLRWWQKHAKLIIAAIVVSVGLALVGGFLIYRKTRPNGPPPPPQPPIRREPWSARFTKAEKLDEHWDYPKGVWSTEAGDSFKANNQDEALVVKGQRMGIPKDLNGEVFDDFNASFKIRLKSKETRAAWVLRAQPDRLGGYLFELVHEGPDLTMYFWLYEKGSKRGDPLAKRTVRFGEWRDSQSFLIDVTVKANQFDYEITFDDDKRAGTSTVGNEWKPNFQVHPSNARWPTGTVGFISTDDTSVMRVEFIHVYPEAKASSSPL